MSFLRPIPRRLLSDDMMVWPAMGDGSYGPSRLVRHVRFERSETAAQGGAHFTGGTSSTLFVDATNSEGAFEIPVGSRVLVGAGPSAYVQSCTRCYVLRGVVHHWKLVLK